MMKNNIDSLMAEVIIEDSIKTVEQCLEEYNERYSQVVSELVSWGFNPELAEPVAGYYQALCRRHINIADGHIPSMEDGVNKKTLKTQIAGLEESLSAVFDLSRKASSERPREDGFLEAHAI